MSHNNKNHAIGVFDSGLGGLTVVKELIAQLPFEHIVYFGDTARVPYGTKSKESIIRFSIENTRVLLKHKVKMIVVACNSSSSYALDALREKFDVPVIGVIEPGAKKAIASSCRQRIGVIATSATIHSQAYTKAIVHLNASARVFSQACPLFVPLVEEGWLRKDVTHQVAEEYLKRLKKDRIDALILGCTHYPLLKSVIKRVMGKDVVLIDSAREVAAEVKDILTLSRNERSSTHRGKHTFLVSDKPQQFERIARNFLRHQIKVNLVLDNV